VWRGAIAEGLAGLAGRDPREFVETADRVVVALNGLAVQAVLDQRHWTTRRQRRFLAAIVADAWASVDAADGVT
jgi:hypothetical protein